MFCMHMKLRKGIVLRFAIGCIECVLHAFVLCQLGKVLPLSCGLVDPHVCIYVGYFFNLLHR